MTRKMWLADGLLLLAAMIWGVAFAVVKNTLDSIPPALLVALRYLIAAGLTGMLFRRHLAGLTREDLRRGAMTGGMLSLAYLTQTAGLQYTTAGKNAFLTTLYVLLVPVGAFLVFGAPLRRHTLLSAALTLAGIGLISLGGAEGRLNRGDALTLLASVFFAAHILCIERFQKKTDALALVVLQYLFCALFALLWHLCFERGRQLTLNGSALMGLLYLAVFSTTIGMTLQNIGQSVARSDHAVILLSMESVFGALSGVLLLGERVTLPMGLGFAVIFTALVLCEMGEKS